MENTTAHSRKQLLYLAIFAVAMGFLEAAVVVYLRMLYYPDGFRFPLAPMALNALSIESLREISTIAMLIAIAFLSGKGRYERLSYFLFSFGVWDIFYYVWLKVLLDWPQSLLTWDILFLIPVTWAAPVLAPVMCSITMIGIALYILHFRAHGYSVTIQFREWVLFFLGTIIIFITFITDYSLLILKGGYLTRLWDLRSDADFQKTLSSYVPESYNWGLFLFGEAAIVAAMIFVDRRVRASIEMKKL